MRVGARDGRLGCALVMLGGWLAACRAPGARSAGDEPKMGVVASNVLFADYAGSAACARCHARIAEAFARSPMHNMTRRIEQAAVHAPFAGEQFRFKDDVAALETHDGLRYLRLTTRERGERLYRVTKVIGGHHREDFAGIEVRDEPGHPTVPGARERILPASFALDPTLGSTAGPTAGTAAGSGAWRYKGYSVMTPERPGLRPGAVWSRTCIFCHNTEPWLDTALSALAPGAPPYQGEVVDALLPPERRAQVRVTDEAGLARALAAEVGRLSVPRAPTWMPREPAPPPPLRQAALDAIEVISARFDERHLVEVGIGCESCHGGAAEHVRHPGLEPSLTPRSPFLRVELPVEKPEQKRALEINRACARCHQVLFTQYPFTWEGGRRSDAVPGGAHISSGEARDLLLGDCWSELSCVACHDPHAPDNRDQRNKMAAALDGPQGSAICQRCHAKYAQKEAVRAHTHHDPDGAGAQCLACHMPRKNMSLDNRLGRYHRIGSPNDPAKVERDRPLECALCHAEKTVGALVEAMERFWPERRHDRAALERLYGSLDARPLEATLRLGKPHEQAVALAVLGEKRERAALPLVAGQLTHPYPIVRYFALRALEQLLGRPVALDLFRDDRAIAADVARLLGGQAAPASLGPRPVEPAAADGEE